MLQAMNTGHDGSLSTVHANAPRDALARLETMVLMAGYDLPVKAIRQQVSSALDMICHIERLEDGSRRVTAVTEVQRMESDVITLQDIFEFKIESFAPDGTINGPARQQAPPGVPAQVREARDRPPDGDLLAPPSPRTSRMPSIEALRWIVPAVVAAVAAFATTPVFAADDSDTAGVEVVEAGSALFPDRAYVLTFPAARGQLAPGT